VNTHMLVAGGVLHMHLLQMHGAITSVKACVHACSLAVATRSWSPFAFGRKVILNLEALKETCT
jgi:hypothetical protein